jgi:hypothetical protein
MLGAASSVGGWLEVKMMGMCLFSGSKHPEITRAKMIIPWNLLIKSRFSRRPLSSRFLPFCPSLGK